MLSPKEALEKARFYEKDMISFMRDMIKIPSESCREKLVVERIRQEMEKVGFDEIKIDGLGNILGRIGSGPRILAMDAHIDTVGIGDPQSWEWDPYEGKMEKGVIFGRGASDQEGGMCSMVYGAAILKEALQKSGQKEEWSLWVVGSVMEEDCDGLCWQYILREGVLKPECVVITEPTNLGIYRGHRGRMEIGVTIKGISCHGSAPERGDNAIYKMSRLALEIEKLNERLKDDPFLGKGTITVTYIDSKSPSLCAVPDSCYIHLDRRLTFGETKESAVKEIQDILENLKMEGTIKILTYAEKAYTDLVYETEKYYPTWVLPQEHGLCKAAVNTYTSLFEETPRVDKWTFSTNGIATMGLFGIPTIGFGPAHEIYAHSVLDQIPVEHLIKAAAFYACFPENYIQENK